MRSIKDTVQLFSTPRFYWSLVISIALIATTLAFIYHDKIDGIESLFINLTYTTILTSLSFFTVMWFQAVEREKFWDRVIFSYLALTISSILGTFIATGIVLFFHSMSDMPHPFWVMLLSNMLITFVAGTILNTWSYYELKVVDLAEKLAQKEISEQRIQTLHAKAKMESLRAKVNPHFLFNTLNSISSLVYSNPDLADDMIQKLANLFRYSLEHESDDMIDLEKELEIVKNYLDIEKVRLNDRLDFTVTVSDDLKRFKIPPFLIQPLVENSIKHGISKKSGGGVIRIYATETDESVILAVKDNGVGFDGPLPDDRFGLKGVSERIRLHFGEKSEIRLLSDNGTTVSLIIPKLNGVSHG